MPPIIHWFRRDVRLDDNTALAQAAHDSGGAVLPVYILTPALLAPQGRFTGAARVRFLFEALHELDATLRAQGSALVLRHGEPHAILPQLVRDSGAQAVYWNHDYTPFARRRDEAVQQALTDLGCTVRTFKDAVIYEAGEILTTTDHTPYNVYSPYARRWRQRLEAEGMVCHPAPTLNLPADRMPASDPLPTLADLGLHTEQKAQPGGESHARELLAAFTDLRRNHAIADYARLRDMPGLPATSRLSAHLHLGTVSPRTCVQAASDTADRSQDKDGRKGPEKWISELIWREFYIQILAEYPHVLRGAYKQAYDALEWENDEALFAAWCAGRTGYPIVDAAMRQLNQEAWMHNRTRMIVASFLTKDLLIDWRWGERYFMRQLVDGDPASNNGGWQWTTGTGTDAQPYFRIFNPITQGKKFDSDGSFVRRYLPELARVPDAALHEPWKMSPDEQRRAGVQIGQDYPAPLVDHQMQRQRALAIYEAVAQK